jgi:hypothetical protein
MERELSEKVLLDLRLRGEAYIQMKMEAMGHLNALHAANAELQSQHDTVLDHKTMLLTTAPELHKITDIVKKWVDTGAMPNASSCVVPQDALHEQAIELLAQNHAADDVMELLEKRLRKGLMSIDDYLKAVSDVARQQFIARLLLRRVQDRVAAESNARMLCRQFPNFDQQMIAEILKTADYDLTEAQARLAELA